MIYLIKIIVARIKSTVYTVLPFLTPLQMETGKIKYYT